MSYITLDEATAFARTLIKEATESDRLLFREWIFQGLMELGVSMAQVKVCTIEAKENRLRLPEDALPRGIKNIALYSGNNEVRYTYNEGVKRIHANDNTLQNAGTYDPKFGSLVEISMDDYYIHLSSLGDTVTHAKIRYYSLPVDEQGQPKIDKDLRLALALFVRYCWEMRNNDNQSAIDQAYKQWIKERNSKRGKRKMPSELEMQAIERYWLTMLPNFNHSKRF